MDACTGPSDGSVSRTWMLGPRSAFEQVGGLAAEVSPEPLQRAFSVVVQQDPHQLHHVLVFKDEIHHFTHGLALRPVAEASRTSVPHRCLTGCAAGRESHTGVRPRSCTLDLTSVGAEYKVSFII